MTWYWEISGRNVFSPPDIFCRHCSQLLWYFCVHLALCLFDMRNDGCVMNCGAGLGGSRVSPLATALPQPSCLCLLWPGACRSPLPSWHTFTGTLLPFPLILACAEPLLPALLRHPGSPINLSWSGLQLLCLSPHHQLSRPERNTYFHTNTEPLLLFPKSPPVRHSSKLMLQAAGAVRSCSCGPPWVGFGYLRNPPQISVGFLQAGRQRAVPVRPCGEKERVFSCGMFAGLINPVQWLRVL